MFQAFDLKKQLKLLDKSLLRRLFEEFRVLADVPWDSLKSHDITPIVEGWDALEGDTRRKLEVVLQDVNELADERSQRVLVEDLEWRCPDNLTAFAERSGLHDKALWAYLDARGSFDETSVYARAEALRGGQFSNRWNGLEKKLLDVTPALIRGLEESVRTYYHEKELRAEHCRVHHYRRANGTDYFYAYLPEWADKRLGFDNAGELTARELEYAFHDVFIFEPNDGALEIIAKGGKKVQLPLRRAFCKSVLDVEVDDTDPIRRCYELDHLLEPTFAFITEPEDCIQSVHIRRVRVMPAVAHPIIESHEPRLRETVTLAEFRSVIRELCEAHGWSPAELHILQIGIQIEFQSNGRGRKKTMTFNVSKPNTCDLKSKPDDVREVGERCIRRWRILRA